MKIYTIVDLFEPYSSNKDRPTLKLVHFKDVESARVALGEMLKRYSMGQVFSNAEICEVFNNLLDDADGSCQYVTESGVGKLFVKSSELP